MKKIVNLRAALFNLKIV